MAGTAIPGTGGTTAWAWKTDSKMQMVAASAAEFDEEGGTDIERRAISASAVTTFQGAGEGPDAGLMS